MIKKNILLHIYNTFILFILFTVLRMLEFIYVSFENVNEITIENLFSRSINYDFLFVFNYSVALLIPIVLLGLINNIIVKIIVKLFPFLLMVIHLILMSYFFISWNLLNSSLFEFSIIEIYNISLAEFTVSNLYLWIGLLFFLWLSYFLFLKIRIKTDVNNKIYLLLLVTFTTCSIITIVNNKYLIKSVKYFKTDYQFLIGNSKEMMFFYNTNNDLEYKNVSNTDYLNSIQNYQSIKSNYNFKGNNYPLVHDEKNSNVLGPFFKSELIKPNVVILICESLSMSYSTEYNCINGSLTPFIDSLSKKGLFWNNFLSNSEKSYGVLPNILGSLPSGLNRRGFVNIDKDYPGFKMYPNHNSMIKMLTKNGYLTNYFYGGWGCFDNVGYFLEENNIQNFNDIKSFDKSDFSVKNSNYWGYHDKDLFLNSFQILDRNKINTPFLNIYQTLSVHSPFNLCEDDYYLDEFINDRLDMLNVKTEDVSQIPKSILASIIFADDALRFFFNEAKKRDGFKNTIFIITGDHNLDINICNNSFEKYRVPLIIYSDLLDTNSVFKGVCSHIDILPSVIGLLENNYELVFEEPKHWIGDGLDTSKYFNSSRLIPLAIKNNILPQFIYKTNAIKQGEVIKFDSLFNIVSEDDKEKIDNINRIFKDYKIINYQTCFKNKIWDK